MKTSRVKRKAKMKRCMKVVSLCLGMVLFFSSGFAWTSGPGVEKKEAATSPSLSLPEPEFVFSQVVEGTEILHDFIVVNRGAATLEIQKVRTD